MWSSGAAPPARSSLRSTRSATRSARPDRWRALDADDLSRVHDVVRVERALQRAHHRDGIAVLGDEEIHFAVADAVLAGAGAVHGDGTLHHAVIEATRLGQLLGLGRIENEGEMKIAVADMADQHGGDEGLIEIGLGLGDAF